MYIRGFTVQVYIKVADIEHKIHINAYVPAKYSIPGWIFT